MGNINFTDSQKEAIFYEGQKPAVVSAAAGSGKTAVLVERVIYLLCRENNPVRADKLAIVTFTVKAAGELSGRLKKRLNQIIEEKGENQFLSQQLERLDSARIGTISSFCLDLLKENGAQAGLGGFLSVLDETEEKILKNQSAQKLIQELYRDPDKCKEVFSLFSTEQELTEFLIDYGNFAKDLINYDKWLENCFASFSPEKYAEKYICPIKTRMSRYFEASISCMEKILEQCGNGGDKYLDKVISFANGRIQVIKAAMDVGEKGKNSQYIDTLVSGLQPAETFPRAGKSPYKELAPTFSALWNEAKKNYGVGMELLEMVLYSPGEEKECAEELKMLDSLYRRYNEIYSEKKAEGSYLDFGDIENTLLKLLREKPEIREKIGKELDYIIVDEFQDSSDVQEEIFRLLSLGRGNLYYVGDERQCIYGFRGSNPHILMNLRENPDYTSITMNENFRSSDEVIYSVNSLFKNGMEADGSSIHWGSMIPGRGIHGESCRTSLVVIDNPKEKGVNHTRLEAEYVAGRIKEMVENNFPIHEGEAVRPVRYGDFAVLLRGVSSKGRVFRKAMEEAGVPVVNKAGGSFTDLAEINLAVNYLKILVNPFDDISMAAVLVSPLYGFTPDELARLRYDFISPKKSEEAESDENTGEVEKRIIPFFTALNSLTGEKEEVDPEYSPEDLPKDTDEEQNTKETGTGLLEKAIEFMSDYRTLRKNSYDFTVSKLLAAIYARTDLVRINQSGLQGRQRRDNLRLLLHYAEKYDSLQEFLEFIKSTKKWKLEMREAEPAEKEETSVKIMTIHGSKGLQYPVVFVSDCGVRKDERDSSGTFLFDAEGGAGLMLSRMELPALFNTACHMAVADIIKNKKQEEENRLLYVAMTRAMDKLILTASCEKPKGEIDAPVGDRLEKLSQGENYLGAALRAFEKDKDMAELEYIGSKEKLPCHDKAAAPLVTSVEAEQSAPMPDIEKIRENLDYKYPFEPQTKIPAKVTATQLGVERGIMEDETDENAFYLSMPIFMKNGRKLTGKERGDIYHKVMEYLDFSATDGKAELKRMVEENILTPEEKAAVKERDIQAFLDSSLCGRIRKATLVQREFPIFTLVNVAGLENPEPEDLSFLQGIADLYFIEDGQVVLVDYKTNMNITEGQLVQEYKGQLDIYAKALGEMTGKLVKEKVLYSFFLGKEIVVLEAGN